MEEKSSYLPQPAHRTPVRTSCQKLTPAAFPLCLFQEILITRLSLYSVPRPFYKLMFLFIQRTGLLLVFTTFLADVLHFDTSCLLVLPVTGEQNELPTTSPPVSLFVFIVWRSKNCLRCAYWRPSCSALITLEPCHAFDCATVSVYPFHGSCPRIDWQCLFLFDVLVTFLRHIREINVWQKFIFGVSLLLNSIFSAY